MRPLASAAWRRIAQGDAVVGRKPFLDDDKVLVFLAQLHFLLLGLTAHQTIDEGAPILLKDRVYGDVEGHGCGGCDLDGLALHGVWIGRRPRWDGLDDDVTGGGHAGFEADICFFNLDDHVEDFDVFFAFLLAAERGDAIDFAVERWWAGRASSLMVATCPVSSLSTSTSLT